MGILLKLAYFLLGILALQFVLGPILVRFVQKLSARPDFEKLDPASLPMDAASFFQSKFGELSPSGFTVRDYLYMTNFVPGQTMHIMMMENKSKQDTALIAVANAGAAKAQQLKVRYVEFYTEFGDGSQLTLNNSPQPHVFKDVPERAVLQFPEIEDAGRLYEVYLRYIEKFGKWGKVSFIGRDMPELLLESISKEMAHQVKTGYFFLDESGNTYRPTAVGAVYMTWKMVWPVSAILKALRRSRNAGLLRELQIESR